MCECWMKNYNFIGIQLNIYRYNTSECNIKEAGKVLYGYKGLTWSGKVLILNRKQNGNIL